jgi:DNA-directed RNA polymerase specialized sigma24 family protein
MAEAEKQTGVRGNQRDLDRDLLDALLEAFAPGDRDLAGKQYEALRRKLLDLFSWERCAAPDELADEAINRLARKVREGVSIPHLDRYAFGIARLIVQEQARDRRKRETALREWRAVGGSGRDPATLAAIEQCLAALPVESRKLIERYYAEDRGALARELGISVNALRNRALRIRDQLFACVSKKRDNS